MKCSICNYEIEKKYMTNIDGEEVMYWDNGHSSEPINDGRCCDICNDIVVLSIRMIPHYAPEMTALEIEKKKHLLVDLSLKKRRELEDLG